MKMGNIYLCNQASHQKPLKSKSAWNCCLITDCSLWLWFTSHFGDLLQALKKPGNRIIGYHVGGGGAHLYRHREEGWGARQVHPGYLC
jgi:hypothetical protein